MKIEHLQDAEPSKDDEVKDPKAAGKKVPVPANQSQLLYEEKMYKIL